MDSVPGSELKWARGLERSSVQGPELEWGRRSGVYSVEALEPK